MKTGTIIFAATAAFATATLANPLENGLISDLQSQGYDFIEVKNAPGQIKVEAIRGTEELEMIFDRQSGQLLKREVNRADARDVGRVGIEFDTRDRNFIGSGGGANGPTGLSVDDDDDDDDDDRSGRDRSSRDRDDDDDRSGRGRGRGGDRDDDDDDDDDDRSGRGGDRDDRDDRD